ncbi:MAG: hypothetical protein U9O96_08230 [Candidatus Thermoplasmatota archaeon]|nr:hypothetical protein [Candidatus Thermoplasmatota archaeon]
MRDEEGLNKIYYEIKISSFSVNSLVPLYRIQNSFYAGHCRIFGEIIQIEGNF